MILKKPKKLVPGDTVALISPSAGLAGEKDILYRTNMGIERLQKNFNLKTKVMKNSLKGIDYLYNHPEKRAEDIHEALLDKNIKALISFIGGKDSLRIVPYLDENIINNNPKIFMGYSDSTAIHLKFLKSKVMSFYGPAVLTDFAENLHMDSYTIDNINKSLFSNKTIGSIETSNYIRKFGLMWEEKNKNIERPLIKNSDYEIINGRGIAYGNLIGGCMESLNNLRGTDLFPTVEFFKNKILFLENSEDQSPLWLLEQHIRTLGYMGILNAVSGIIIGKPQNNINYDEYKDIWKKMAREWKIYNTPIFYNASFGHNEPKCIIPFGAFAKLDTNNKTFHILENSCI